MNCNRGGGSSLKKLEAKFKKSATKRPRRDDSDQDYDPDADSQAQSSEEGDEVSMEAENLGAKDEAIDITGWAFPENRWSAEQYSAVRNPYQYALPRDTNILYFHTQVQFNAFWSHVRKTSIHVHKTIDWNYMLTEPVMSDLVERFNQCGLYDFLENRVDYNEMIIHQFYATAEVNMDARIIEWMTGKRKYEATFEEFAIANKLNYGVISNGADLLHEDAIENVAQYYEPQRLGIPTLVGTTTGLRHHPAVINKIARVTILTKGGDRNKVRDKFWNIISYVMNREVMDVITFMMDHVSDLQVDKSVNLVYAPYIMALILQKNKVQR